MMQALEAGAKDFEEAKNSFVIFTSAPTFTDVKQALETSGINDFITAEVRYEPNQMIKLDPEKAERILSFIEKLEADDDVQEVYHNLDPDSF